MPDYHEATSNRELISSTRQCISIEDDIGAIQRVSQSLLAYKERRDARREASRTVLQGLSRQLEQARGVAANTDRQRDEDHGTVMNSLDRDKFALAKEINALEGSAHTLSSRLAHLTATLENMNEDVMQEPNALAHEQGAALRLAVYRDLGIRLVEDASGAFSKAVVCTKGGKDVHVLELEQSAGQYADELWSLSSA